MNTTEIRDDIDSLPGGVHSVLTMARLKGAIYQLCDEVDRLRETIMTVEYELDHPNDETRSVIDRTLKIIADAEK